MSHAENQACTKVQVSNVERFLVRLLIWAPIYPALIIGFQIHDLLRLGEWNPVHLSMLFAREAVPFHGIVPHISLYPGDGVMVFLDQIPLSITALVLPFAAVFSFRLISRVKFKIRARRRLR